jgi:sirohydrochlorin cobaltochelatase
MGLFASVTAAYRRGGLGFGEVLDCVDGEAFAVVPLMTSAGWFCEKVLPEMLCENRRFGEVRVWVAQPVGTHERVFEVVADEVGQGAARHGFASDETTVLVVGHGTERHSESGASTIGLARRMGSVMGWHDVRAAFLDEVPMIEEAFAKAVTRNVIVYPFLVGGGAHARMDVSGRIGLGRHVSEHEDVVGNVGERRVVICRPFGACDAVAGLVVDRAREAVVGIGVGR